MLLRALLSLGFVAMMMAFVFEQMRAAEKVKWLTVEQLLLQNIPLQQVEGAEPLKGLTFDRHYAMPIDFCIIAPFVGLVIFLCTPQWTAENSSIALAISAVASLVLVAFWYNLPGKEAHNQSLQAAIYHGLFLFVAVWAVLMGLVYTPRPEPVLLLAMGIILPAFLFVGTHMYLGLINLNKVADTFSGNPLKDVVGWGILLGATGLVWWRVYMLIPSSFWQNL